jgi:hypothetical protein
LDWTNGKNIESLMAMVGGYPYLVRLAFYHLVGKGGLEGDLEQLLQQAPTEAGIYHEYLKQFVLVLQDEPELQDAFYEVINVTTYVQLEPALACKLQSMGLINLEGDRSTVGCELYRLYFRQYLKKSERLNNNCVEQLF